MNIIIIPRSIIIRTRSRLDALGASTRSSNMNRSKTCKQKNRTEEPNWFGHVPYPHACESMHGLYSFLLIHPRKRLQQQAASDMPIRSMDRPSKQLKQERKWKKT